LNKAISFTQAAASWWWCSRCISGLLC